MASLVQIATEQFGDWRWRLNNLYYITDEQGQRVLFRMNWAQDDLFAAMHELNVILKARQLGFTTFIQLFMLDACMFNSNIRAGTIAHTREDSEAFFRDKVKYPYDSLPDGLRAANPATEDSARKLSFGNNSSIRVGTSLRSGTFQYLHVSEYGKICAKFPDKAKEIKTGAFNTVHPGNIIFVESTAEGQDGEFYDMCQRSQAAARLRDALTPMDFKFHFYPWWRHPGYRLEYDVLLTSELKAYFAKMETAGIALEADQKAWYAKKAIEQGEDMKREFPSTPEEAFEASIEGAYYGKWMVKAEESRRICELPHDPALRTETWWDLGLNDMMSIAWVQRDGPWINFIDYYENNSEGFDHYARILQEKQDERDLIYSRHLWPHDGNTRILDETGRKRIDVMRGLGYEPEIVPRGFVSDGITAVRRMLPKSRFDRERCEILVKAMKSYRKEWDEDRAVFKDKPLHNWAGHPADMVRTGAMAPDPDEPEDDLDYSGLGDDRSVHSGY